MATPGADGKQLANSAYHDAVMSGLAIGFSTLGRKIFKSATPKFDFAPYDLGMVVLDIGLAGDTPRGHIEVNGLIRTATRWPL